MRKLSPITVFFIGSGIDGGRLCYHIGIVGNILYVVTTFPGNPVVGRGPVMRKLSPITVFFIGSGIDEVGMLR